MEEMGYRWERLAGTSAGSVVAALLAGGYSAKELEEVMKSLDYAKLLGRTWLHRVPVLGMAAPLLLRSGIYVNDVLEEKMTEWLGRKGVATFGDLPEGKLKIIASDISAGRMLVLPDDLPKYRIAPASFPIAAAVRMSTTIPYFFQPYRLRPRPGRRVHYILDGGLLSNYPIWIFDVEGTPRWPTIGFRLSERQAAPKLNPINGPISMFGAIFRTMLKAHDQRHANSHAESRTIFIPTENVSTTQFDLSDDDRDELFRSGQCAARKFLTRWSLEQYIKVYRSRRR